MVDVERLARIPCGVVFPASSPLPRSPGYRLVLQHISAQLQASAPPQLALSIGTGLGSQANWLFDGPLGGNNIGGINQDLLTYFDPADGPPNVTAPGGGVLNGTVTLTGYLEKLLDNGVPCDPALSRPVDQKGCRVCRQFRPI